MIITLLSSNTNTRRFSLFAIILGHIGDLLENGQFLMHIQGIQSHTLRLMTDVHENPFTMFSRFSSITVRDWERESEREAKRIIEGIRWWRKKKHSFNANRYRLRFACSSMTNLIERPQNTHLKARYLVRYSLAMLNTTRHSMLYWALHELILPFSMKSS